MSKFSNLRMGMDTVLDYNQKEDIVNTNCEEI